MTDLSESVEKSLKAARLGAKDQGAAQLCRHYAALMDDAERLAEEAERAWEELSLDDIDGRRRLARLEAMLAPRVVANDLGPKLLAGLTALGLTLAGRGEKGKADEHVADPVRAAHDEIGARRAARKHNPTA